MCIELVRTAGCSPWSIRFSIVSDLLCATKKLYFPIRGTINFQRFVFKCCQHVTVSGCVSDRLVRFSVLSTWGNSGLWLHSLWNVSSMGSVKI